MYMYTIYFNPCVLNKDSHTYLTNLKYNDFLNSILYCKLQYIYLICLISCTALKDHLYTTKVLTYKADIGFCLYKKHIVLYYMRNRLFTIEKQLKSNFFFYINFSRQYGRFTLCCSLCWRIMQYLRFFFKTYVCIPILTNTKTTLM